MRGLQAHLAILHQVWPPLSLVMLPQDQPRRQAWPQQRGGVLRSRLPS